MKNKTFLFTIVALMSLSGCTTVNPGEVITEKEVTSITLNETAKDLVVDDTFQLVATVLPADATNKNVTWSSSNSSVASVSSEGMVTALKAGNTTVTVTSVSKTTIKATCNISVSNKVVEVSSVTLNETSKAVTEGDTFTLTATVLPSDATDRSVTWSSSNTSVATVSNGVVTTLKDGSATITVTSNSKNSVKATCNLVVNAKEVPPSLDEMNITPKVFDDGTQITVSKNSFTYNNISVSNVSGTNVYGTGENALRLGSRNNAGNIQFTLSDALVITKVVVDAKSYNNDSDCQLKVTTSANTSGKTVSVSQSKKYEFTLSSTSESTWLKIESVGSSRKRVIVNSITVEAEPLEKVYPNSISLQDTNVDTGSTVQLIPVFEPSTTNQKSVTWDSSNKNVATVNSNGVVSGVKAGTATITATGKNENGQDVTGSCIVTVKDVAVSGVTLSQTALSVAVGKEKTLTPTISPSNATNKNVSWKSSNTSIATVTNGVVKGVANGTATITVTTEDGNKTATCQVTVADQLLDDWTLLFYICGADLESDSSQGGYATSDINEILSKRTSQPDSVNIVVETGGAKSWKTSYISSNKLERFEINSTSSQMIKKQTLANASMGKAETLQSFLEWGLSEYPAERYGLFMWNHGGAMDGCCFDENYDDDSLFADEVDQAVTAAKTTVGINGNLEFIAYDACLMAVQDVAEWNSHNFNYMICSQESEYGGGYDYDAWLPTLYNNPSSVNTVTLLSKIGDTFMDYYEKQSCYDQTQSVLDLSKMAAYKEAWEDMSQSLSSMMTSSLWSTFSSLVNKAKKYGKSDTSGYNNGYTFDVFDAKGALTYVKGNANFSSLSGKIDTVISLLDELVVYERHGSQMSGSNGLCMFCPISGYNQKTTMTYQGTTYYPNYSADRTNFKKWQSLCAQYGKWYA